MVEIKIKLPKETRTAPPWDRAKYGELVVLQDGKQVYGPIPCLGKGGGRKDNPSWDWRNKEMDTPTGKYIGTIVYGWKPESSYGTAPVIRLDPDSGNALEAEKLGRSGFAIHEGGDPEQKILFSTYGCIRTFRRHQEELINKLISLGAVLQIRVEVTEA